MKFCSKHNQLLLWNLEWHTEFPQSVKTCIRGMSIKTLDEVTKQDLLTKWIFLMFHIKLQCICLDYESAAKEVLELFRKWDVAKPDVILSVLSTDEGNGVTVTKPSESSQNFKKKICSSIVEAASSTSAYTIFCLSISLYMCVHVCKSVWKYVYMYSVCGRYVCMYMCMSVCIDKLFVPFASLRLSFTGFVFILGANKHLYI